jgi:hypothetical protein
LAWKILNIHPYDTGYWKPLASSALILAALYLFAPERQELIGAPALILLSLSAAAAYLLVLAGLGLDSSDRYIIGKLKERLAVR